jgi:hypothetical protein
MGSAIAAAAAFPRAAAAAEPPITLHGGRPAGRRD